MTLARTAADTSAFACDSRKTYAVCRAVRPARRPTAPKSGGRCADTGRGRSSSPAAGAARARAGQRGPARAGARAGGRRKVIFASGGRGTQQRGERGQRVVVDGRERRREGPLPQAQQGAALGGGGAAADGADDGGVEGVVEGGEAGGRAVGGEHEGQD